MCTKDEAVAVVCAAIGHVIALWATDFIAGEVCGGEEFYFGDDNCFVAGRDCIGGGVFKLVGCYKECICWGMEDAGFVEVGGARVFDEALEGGIGAKDREE